MKNPLALAVIEPATFRFVAQYLNHCATAVPQVILYIVPIITDKRVNTNTKCVYLFFFINSQPNIATGIILVNLLSIFTTKH